MDWVAKITTVGLEMALPAIGGAFLDRRLGTSYWALAGVVLGFVCGMVHLLQMTAAEGRRIREAKQREASRDDATRKD
jgi:F0F1-type ATP synthase assembly protein I